MENFDNAKWFTIYSTMVNRDLRQEALKLRKQITALETELKAAADHAGEMEGCAKEAEAKLAASVPFEVVQKILSEIEKEREFLNDDTTVQTGLGLAIEIIKQNCPLLKGKADE